MGYDAHNQEEHGPNTLDQRLGGPSDDEICAAFDEHLRSKGWKERVGELHFFAAGAQWATERRAAAPSPTPTQLDTLRALAEGWQKEAVGLRSDAAAGLIERFDERSKLAAVYETCRSALLTIIGR